MQSTIKNQKEQSMSKTETKTTIKTSDIVAGFTFTTNAGCTAIVVNVVSSRDVCIEFLKHGNQMRVAKSQIQKRSIKNPMSPSVHGEGYIGTGPHKEGTTAYKKWKAMINRCYGPEKKEAYKDVTVCEEWKNYQYFAEWFHHKSNYQDGWTLDKDILGGDHKVYSPETCIFVPSNVNHLYGKDPTKTTLPEGNKLKGDSGKTRVTYKGKTLGTNHHVLAEINLRLSKLEDTLEKLSETVCEHPLTLKAIESLENQIDKLCQDYVDAESDIFLNELQETEDSMNNFKSEYKDC